MRRTLLLAPFVLAAALAACDTVEPDSLYDPGAQSAPAPVIATVEPAGAAYAGVSLVTIRGEHFAAEPSRNLVYFGPDRATVVQASPTELVVRPPNSPATDLPLRVSVLGAAAFSNPVPYDLLPVAERFGRIAGFEEPFGITVGPDGRVLASLFSTNVSAGIVAVEPGGGRPTYTASTFKWDALQMAPGGDALFGVRGVRAVFRLPEGGAQETYAVAADAGARFTALDLAPDGALWTGGAGGNLYRVPPGGGTPTAFPFAPTVRALVVADGTLYVAADAADGTSAVWRFPIGADGALGEGTPWVDVTAATDGGTALALAAATSGELFVGTDADDPLLLVAPDGTAEPLYPGILDGPLVGFAWGDDGVLYAVRGRTIGTAPDLLRIVTLREGVR